MFLDYEIPDNVMEQLLAEDVWHKAGIKTAPKVNEEVKPEVKPEAKSEDKPAEKIDEAAKEPKIEDKKEEKKEEHVCPLCESKLANPLSDEKLLEHVEAMAQMFDEVHEELLKEEAGKKEKEAK